MNRLIITEPQQPFIGPPCPDQCPDGAESHTWLFDYDAGHGGSSIRTDECFICNQGAALTDWPTEYLVIQDIPVKLEAHTEVSGYYEPEYDHYVTMTPVVGTVDYEHDVIEAALDWFDGNGIIDGSVPDSITAIVDQYRLTSRCEHDHPHLFIPATPTTESSKP